MTLFTVLMFYKMRLFIKLFPGRLNMLSAAVEERRKHGDELGDLGRNKEISPEERVKIEMYLKKLDRECQKDLVSKF
jgi:hypothetical protein